MAVFYQREIRPPRIQENTFLPRMEEGFFSLIREDWMGIYYQGRQLGFSHTSLYPHRKEGFYGSALENTVWLEIPVGGSKTRLSSHAFCLLETGGTVKSLKLNIHNSLPPLELEGRTRKGALLITLRTGKGEKKFSLPLLQPSIPFYALSPFLSMRNLQKGTAFRLPAFDPLKGLTGGRPETGNIRFQVVDKDKNGYHLVTSYLGVTIDIYLDQTGEVTRIDTPLGWKLERQSHKQVMAFLKQRGNENNEIRMRNDE